MKNHLMSKKEAAEYLKISERTLDRRRERGRISCISDHKGARVHYRQDDLDKYIKACTHRAYQRSV